jgi:AraC-like DNA-binding protein
MEIKDVVFVYHLVEDERVAWHGRYHAHGYNEYELHFFLDGDGTFLCGKTRYPITPGSFFLTGPQEFHSIIPDMTARPITYYALLFQADSTGGSLEQLLDDAIKNRRRALTIHKSHRLQFEDIVQLYRSGEASLQKAAEHLLMSVIFRFFHLSESNPGEPEKIKLKNRAHVEHALAFMQDSVRTGIGVAETAQKLGLSTEHFIRIFREEVNMTPRQYFIRLKVEGASGLLISTSKSIAEIADWFGFENQFHFSRVFHKCTGVPPSQYRKTYLQTVDFRHS